MQQRNSKNDPKTTAFLNIDVQIQAENGEWYSFKGGIPVTDKKASERGLVANPTVLDDPKRMKVTVALNVLNEEPKEVSFG